MSIQKRLSTSKSKNTSKFQFLFLNQGHMSNCFQVCRESLTWFLNVKPITSAKHCTSHTHYTEYRCFALDTHSVSKCSSSPTHKDDDISAAKQAVSLVSTQVLRS